MAEVHAAVSAAADEPLRSEPTLAAEVAASTRANVLYWAAGIARDHAWVEDLALAAAALSKIHNPVEQPRVTNVTLSGPA